MVARFPIADDDKIQRQKQRHLHSQEFHICSEKLEAQLLQLPCSNRQICHCELLHRCCTHASLCSCCSLIGRICTVACSSWDAMLIIYAMCYIWSDVSARPFMNQMELSPTLFYTVTFRIYFSLCTSFGPMCFIIFRHAARNVAPLSSSLWYNFGRPNDAFLLHGELYFILF